MKKVTLSGTAEVKAARGREKGELTYAYLKINGRRLDEMLVLALMDADDGSDGHLSERRICRVKIAIDPDETALFLNGEQEISLED